MFVLSIDVFLKKTMGKV